MAPGWILRSRRIALSDVIHPPGFTEGKKVEVRWGSPPATNLGQASYDGLKLVDKAWFVRPGGCRRIPLLWLLFGPPHAAGLKLEDLVGHRHPKPPGSPKQPIPPKFPHPPPQPVAAMHGMVWGRNVSARGAKQHRGKLKQGEGSRGTSSRHSPALWEM